jgi:hypothetical protein
LIVVDVNMTQPTTGTAFTQSGAVILKAGASMTGGTLSKFEFFNGTKWLYTATSTRYFCPANNTQGQGEAWYE